MREGLTAHVQSTVVKGYESDLGTVLLLEPLEMLGNFCFILCAALTDFLDMEDNGEVREGELRCYASNRLALVIAKTTPLPNGRSAIIRPPRKGLIP